VKKFPKRYVYILTHVVRPGTDSEDFKMLGVFSSRSAAGSALQIASKLPGFRDFTSGLSIDRYLLNKLEWREGFFTTRHS
jgi:hypothetical protein